MDSDLDIIVVKSEIKNDGTHIKLEPIPTRMSGSAITSFYLPLDLRLKPGDTIALFGDHVYSRAGPSPDSYEHGIVYRGHGTRRDEVLRFTKEDMELLETVKNREKAAYEAGKQGQRRTG